MATSFAPVLLRLLDDYGYTLAGGSVETFEAGTTTPLATYQDADGLVPNANPVPLDAGGSATIRVTNGVAYKFVVRDVDGNIMRVDDDIIVGEAPGSSLASLYVAATYCGTPGAQAFLGGMQLVSSVVFPIDFDGSAASVGTAPASSYVVSVKKNGTTVGTITFAAGTGVATFATTGGATVTGSYNDRFAFYAPDTVGTAADILITLVGAL